MKKKLVLLIVGMASLAMLVVAGPKLEFTWKNSNYSRRDVQENPGAGAEWESGESR